LKIEDFSFSAKFRKETDLLDFVNDVKNIVNLGRYQMRVSTDIPTWTGEGGEHLLYISGTVRRLYFYDDVNSTWQYLEWNTSGLAHSTIVATAQLTAQAGDILATTLYTPAAAGLFKINVYHICHTAGAAGTLNTLISWTDAVSAKTLSPASDITLTSTNNGATGNAFFNSAAAGITYTATITGGAGSPKYNLYLTLEQLV